MAVPGGKYVVFYRGFLRKGIPILTVIAMFFLQSCAVYRRPGQRTYEYPRNEFEARQQGAEARAAEPGTISQVVEWASPAVVGIATVQTIRDPYSGAEETARAVGSGFIVHPSGYILTNDHVAGGNPRKITVILHNGDELEGKTLWSDPTLDLAVVKVNASNLPSVELGNSEELVVGETVIAIGTPLSLQFQHTVTSGIVSALHRTINVPTERGENFMEDLIQTDAPINPGNSGGPLLNLRGQVIGINTIKVSEAEGLGFAIPIDVAKPIVEHFLKDGEFVTPFIGIVGFDKKMASYYKQRSNIQDGVYVANIVRESPAYKAGLRIDDIITQIGDQKVKTMLDLRKTLYSYNVGDRVTIRYLRGDREMEVSMILEADPRSGR